MNLKEQVAQLEAAKEAAQSYAAKFKTQASSEGLENIADDFIAGAKWAIEKLHTPQPEGVKPEEAFKSLWIPLSESMPEDNHNCLWCTVPICEPPYSGCCCDTDFPGIDYFTHYLPYKNEHWPND